MVKQLLGIYESAITRAVQSGTAVAITDLRISTTTQKTFHRAGSAHRSGNHQRRDAAFQIDSVNCRAVPQK